MADRPDFPALAHAITLAAGRMAHGSTPVQSVADRLALALAAAWPTEPAPRCVHCGEALENVSGSPDRPPHWVHISTDPRAPIGSAQCVGDAWGEIARPVDTPGQHITWATNLIAQMSRQRLDSAQTFAIDEALTHLRRASELISDEVWADAPAGVLEDERGDLVVCDTCWSRRGGGGAPPDDCPECGGRGMIPAPEQHGPRCSSNPEIGCVCGLAERQSEEDERRNAPDQRRTINVIGANVAVGDRIIVGASEFAVTDIDTADPHIRLYSIAGSGVLLAAGRLQTLDIIPGSSR